MVYFWCVRTHSNNTHMVCARECDGLGKMSRVRRVKRETLSYGCQPSQLFELREFLLRQKIIIKQRALNWMEIFHLWENTPMLTSNMCCIQLLMGLCMFRNTHFSVFVDCAQITHIEISDLIFALNSTVLLSAVCCSRSHEIMEFACHAVPTMLCVSLSHSLFDMNAKHVGVYHAEIFDTPQWPKSKAARASKNKQHSCQMNTHEREEWDWVGRLSALDVRSELQRVVSSSRMNSNFSLSLWA